MNDDLDSVGLLVRKFPRLFRGEAPPYSYVMPGWLDLVAQLLTDIDALLDDEQAARFRVEEIKEKFGALRFYWTLEDVDAMAAIEIDVQVESEAEPSAVFMEIRDRTAEAERASKSVCELCGAPGSIRGGDTWMRPLCDACAARNS